MELTAVKQPLSTCPALVKRELGHDVAEDTVAVAWSSRGFPGDNFSAVGHTGMPGCYIPGVAIGMKVWSLWMCMGDPQGW